ncbi:MAG: host attachment protein [Planctomycetota bacterium]
MLEPKDVWLVVADKKSARLLHGTGTRHAGLHLAEVSAIATSALAKEHGRPTRMSQPGRSAPRDHDTELATAHFAAQIADWLARELPAHQVGRVALFAPAHLLGALRQALPKDLAGQVGEHIAELARLPAPELAQHPQVMALLAS